MHFDPGFPPDPRLQQRRHVVDTPVMVTQREFAAFLLCPTKSYLLAHDVPSTATPLTGAQEQLQRTFLHDGLAKLCDGLSGFDLFTGAPERAAIQQHTCRFVLECPITTPLAQSRLHGMELVRSGRQARLTYAPLRVVSHEKLSTADKLILAFDGTVLTHVCGAESRVGKIIHGREFIRTSVPLNPLYAKVRAIIARIAAQNSNPIPPPLVLNSHCAECDYQSRCQALANEADDLSLLARLTEKERRKYRDRGVFTVTQLSYTFRPSKSLKYDHALKALAIRKKQIHVVGFALPAESGTLVYFDVEGDPDRDFYYCIGLRYTVAGITHRHSFWADDLSDEGSMWDECLRILSRIDNPHLVHYGNYETTFLRRMKKRYGMSEATTLIDSLIASAVNLVTIIFGKVYSPTYSNGLKDIAGYLGFRWTETAASGLLAIAWRRQWEYSKAANLKDALLRYNAEDCAAAQMEVFRL